MSLGRFGGTYAALHAGHLVGDYWCQTNHQAEVKGKPGRDGHRACLRHVATLTATQGTFLGLACWTSRERLSWRLVAAGLAVNAVSHYVADRRRPIRWLADRLEWTGKGTFYRSGEGIASGAAHLDQAWHIGWLAITSAIIAGSCDR